jgi:hypothetical protein
MLFCEAHRSISELPGAMYPMEPLIPMELLEFIGCWLVASSRILAMPKSPHMSSHVLIQKNVTWL